MAFRFIPMAHFFEACIFISVIDNLTMQPSCGHVIFRFGQTLLTCLARSFLVTPIEHPKGHGRALACLVAAMAYLLFLATVLHLNFSCLARSTARNREEHPGFRQLTYLPGQVLEWCLVSWLMGISCPHSSQATTSEGVRTVKKAGSFPSSRPSSLLGVWVGYLDLPW